jgi:hypothetical protein
MSTLSGDIVSDITSDDLPILHSHDVDIDQYKIEYTCPLMRIRSRKPKLKYQRDFDAVKANLYNFNPAIANIDMSNLVIAGGAVAHALYSNLVHDKSNEDERSIHMLGDIDFFVYGLSSLQEVSDRIKQLCREICANLSKHLDVDTEISISKKLNTITIDVPDHLGCNWKYECTGLYVPIQIIYHNYKSIADILNSFDVQCCKCAFTGTEVLMTEDALVSHATKTIVLDIPKIKHTYEHRVIKYMNRGYDFAVKNLNIRKIDADMLDDRHNRPTYSMKLPRLGIRQAMISEDEPNTLKMYSMFTNLEVPENTYGANMTVPVVSARKKHTITEAFEVRGRSSEREKMLKMIESKSLIRPLEYYYDLFLLDYAHLAETADNLGLTHKEFQELKNKANLQEISVTELLKPLVDAKLPGIKQAYDDCLSRLIIHDNIIWDVTGYSIKIPTIEEWYGDYYIDLSQGS